jgi:MFS family permease
VGLAVAAAVVAYGVMNLLMTATPLAMLCAGHDFNATATVIQWHLVAMFAPSFLTGGLITRIGALPVMALGVLASLAAIGIALLGDRYGHFQVALVLVGLGWNLLYVGATTRLAERWRDEEKGRLQALNDSLVFAGVTLATFAAAPLVDRLGWALVNGLTALPLLVLLACLGRALLRGRVRLASAG